MKCNFLGVEWAGMEKEEMTYIRQYIRIERKRLISTLPGVLLSLFTVLLLAVLLFALAQGFLPEALKVKPFRIGLCIEGTEQNMISVYISSAIQQMESIEELVEFEEISLPDMKENQEWLEEKELTACIIIPEKTVDSIMNGTNIPIRVVMGRGTDNAERYLQQRLLMLLTECGATLIDVPQAETLLLYEMQVENPEELGRTLDMFHFGLVMAREDWFEKETISAFGNAGLREYYLAAGLTLLLLFWGLGCGSFFETRRVCLPLLFERRGISLLFQRGVRQGLYILWYLAPVFIPVIAGNIGKSRAEGVLFGVLLAAMLSLQSSFFFEITPTAAGGVVCNSIWGLVGFFGAGGILPAVFLPDFVTKVCDKLPVGICMGMLLQRAGGSEIRLCLLWCLFFAVAGQFVFYHKQRKLR